MNNACFVSGAAAAYPVDAHNSPHCCLRQFVLGIYAILILDTHESAGRVMPHARAEPLLFGRSPADQRGVRRMPG